MKIIEESKAKRYTVNVKMEIYPTDDFDSDAVDFEDLPENVQEQIKEHLKEFPTDTQFKVYDNED